MPIKPENKKLYPPRREWQAIRAEVLERAGKCCEWPGCGVPDGTLGMRDTDGTFLPESAIHGYDSDCWPGARPLRIILTIAHLDHDPRNNGTPGNRPNLAALCQYHHLAYDRAHHLANGRKTRDAKKGQVAMELTAQSAPAKRGT